MVPTRNVPYGLTPEEYFKLGIQYMLMGWKKQAASAMKFAIEGNKDLSGTPFCGMPEEQRRVLEALLVVVETTFDLGENVASAAKTAFEVFEVLLHEADHAIDNVASLSELKQELTSFFKFVSKQSETAIDSLMNEFVLPSLGLPTRDLPEGLPPYEYLSMGLKYKEMGWTEQARDAFLKVIELDSDSEDADTARMYLKTRIPRLPVPHYAVKKNILGHRQMLAGLDDFAKRTFEELIADYADFEWPYGNLGLILIRRGEIDGAEEVLNRALDLNPYYLNAWLHLARAKAVALKLREAKTCLEQAVKLDANDNSVKSFQILLDYLASL
ncbi:MAG TPA: tetratricopeptide repeat protein [Candidatus Obscuribacterales bacterium]